MTIADLVVAAVYGVFALGLLIVAVWTVMICCMYVIAVRHPNHNALDQPPSQDWDTRAET